MRTKRSYWMITLLSLLLFGSVQRVAADDNQPRIMLPSADFSGDEIGGIAYITPGNPYFTVFLWRLNESRQISKWENDPFLVVDDHKVQLWGFSNCSTKKWECYDSNTGEVYFYVTAGNNIRAGSNKTFQAQFSKLTKKSHWDDDNYIPLNIFIPHNTPGTTHKVSAYGDFRSDEGLKGKVYYNKDAKNLEDGTIVESKQTAIPAFEEDKVKMGCDLKWTAPGKLTFISNSFKKKDWGVYNVSFEDVVSRYVTEDTVSVTKDYGTKADYQSTVTKLVNYSYSGTYYPDDPTKRNDGPDTYEIWFNGSSVSYEMYDYNLYSTSYSTNTLLKFDKAVTYTKYFYWITKEDTKFSFSCYDKNIKKIELFDDYRQLVKEWTGLSQTPDMDVPKGVHVGGMKITYDRGLQGFMLFFDKSFYKEPQSLPKPTELTPTYNAWDQSVTLKWNLANTTNTNRLGSFVIFRDGTKINTVDANSSTNFSYTDKNVAFDQTYNYKITFVPQNWQDGSYDDLLSISTSAKLERTVKIENLQAVARSDGYRISWSVAPELDRSGYKFRIYRRTLTADAPNPSADDFEEMDPLATIDVTNKSTLNYSYDDKQVTSTATYAYLVEMEDIQATKLIAGPVTPTGELSASHVKKLTATKGTYTDHVHLAWDQSILGSDNLVCDIWRHKIKEGENEVTTLAEAQELDWDKIASLTSTSAQPVSTYDDKSAVAGYYYVYAVVGRPNGSDSIFNRIAADGFVRCTGQLSGSVTYADGKYAVEGVKMLLLTSATNDSSPLFNSLAFSGGKGGLHWNAASEKAKEYFSKAFSVQMYVYPTDDNSAGTCLLDMGGRLRISLGEYDPTQGYALTLSADGGTFNSAYRIPVDRFTHMAFAYDGSNKGALYLIGLNSLKTDSLVAQDFEMGNLAMTKNDTLHVVVGADADSTHTLNGYVDEVRLFKRQLTSADVKQNYSHYLGGAEDGLVAYWTFDEGISTLRRAYDYSKTGDTPNENHALIVGGQRTNGTKPDGQLSLYAVTDTLGAYTLREIPFSGAGTTYSLQPSKGGHKFSPTSRTIYVSPSTLTFDPQNFTDNSSFNVKGVVYYENTTYPVKGCHFRVDDVTVKDEWGNEVLSDENGEFCIPVSIGQHAIYVEKDGHTFLNNGRYPKSGLLNVNDSISHLTFTDQTKAVVVGRVAGGAIEKNKPLGMGLSNANIGAATLTLYTSTTIEDSRRMNVELDSIEGVFNSRTDTLYYEQANPDRVKSRAWVNGCTNEDPTGMKRITIQTDPNTGEFAVLLPPVPYYIETRVDHNDEATTYLKEQALLDCSNVLVTKRDSALVDGKWLSMDYNSAFVKTYFSAPVLSVSQSDNNVGAFGDAIVPAGELNDSVATYTYDKEKSTLTYNYGYPIFTSCKSYQFNISSYEQYFNYDNDDEHPIEDDVPSTEGYLTFKNPMVLTADTVAYAQLDSLGQYKYKFQAIEPNIGNDNYTQPIDITLTIGDNKYLWNWTNGDYRGNLQCVVLGAILTGETSVTSAPDKLMNILRDPFGSQSNMVWNTGSSHTFGFNVSTSTSVLVDTEYENDHGISQNLCTGAPGLYYYKEMKLSGGLTREMSWEPSIQYGGGVTWNITTLEEFRTSAEPYYDGPNGDVFIGMSSSLVYGDGVEVKLVNNQDNGYKVGTREVIATAQGLGTTFAYSQDYVINQLIPNFKRLREARLMKVSEEELAAYKLSFVNTTDSVIYMTSLSVDDPRFGSNNTDVDVWGKEQAVRSYLRDSSVIEGPSYTCFIPQTVKNEEETWDAIETINMQIQNWEGFLALNEEGKVESINSGNKKENISFDSGSGWSETYKFDLTESGNVGFTSTFKKLSKAKLVGGNNAKEKTGSYSLNFTNVFNPSAFYNHTSVDDYTVKLSDTNADNTHQVAMYNARDGFSYVFYQSSGQTSRNYEGEKRTEYYQPGHYILSNGTVQIETPHIDCEHPTVTGVPDGQPAVFDLKLSNPTMANVTRNIDFDLWIDNDKYAKMAKVTVNGVAPNGNSYPVLLSPGGTAEVSLSVTPASSDVIHIDSLHVYFSSAGQVSVCDDIYLSAHFQPKAEAVTLTASTGLVNSQSDSTLVLTASGYNLNSSILNGVMLQQRKENASDWTIIHSWVRGTPAGDTESKLESERIDTLIDMHSSIFYPDATYEFRAVTDCTVAGEKVLGESNICTVIKDVTLPQPIELPEPSDGVLSYGDNIKLMFNEPINSQSLNEVDNFIIQSVLNTDSVAHDVALRLDGASTPAATSQSGLTLGGTSFTLCSWVKNSGTAGTLFRHGEGQNAFRVGIDGEGYLTVSIKDENGVAQTYRALDLLPKDIWSYVAVVYDVTTGKLGAYYASGDNEATLMDAVPVGKYANSEGNIYLGEGLTGAMHELSLFTAPLSWSVIKSQMYLGKSHSTPSLIGYWRLDEGHGNKSEDLARSRHMTLSSANSWYMENENLSMALDGTHAAGIPMGQLSTTQGVSYLVEMWMLADEQQTGNPQLISLEGNKLDLNIVDGQLQLTTDSVTVNSQLSTLNLADGQWHHVALNVLKSGSGQASVLVDGVSVLSVPSDLVPPLAGSHLWLGRNMKGMLDEVRLWHGMNTQETINERMYYRLDGTNEKSLVAYYPMEKTYYDEYDQRVFEFALDNKGYETTASTTLVPDTEGVTFSEGSNAPGLKMAPHKTNLDFSFVANDEKLSITLDHSAEALEGCNVSVTLRDFTDKHENIGMPVTWSFVVKRNPLSWNTGEVNIRETAGQDASFTATLTNNGQDDEQWSFTELPSWLEASQTSGTIFAHGSVEITFTVKPGNAIGKYFTTVSACGSMGLDTPIDICLTVEGKRPDWTCEETGWSMVATGQIKIDGILSTDTEDMVAAFDDSEGDLGKCIGVGQPRYKSNKDAYYVDMVIFGSKEMEGKPVHFRIYDASTGKIYQLTKVSEEVTFKSDATVGTSSNPLIWENSDKLLELADLKEGYQWLSFYLKPDDTTLSLFNPVKAQISSVQVSPDDNDTYTCQDGSWSGTYDGINAGMMMKVQMNGDAMLPVVGTAVDPADYVMTINPSPAVNWIGVPTDCTMTLDQAFAALSPEEGDQVRSQTAFSTFEDGAWDGQLEAIEPGKGYIYISNAATSKTFTFPSLSDNATIPSWSSQPGIAANFKYRHNMVVICTIHDHDGQPVQAKSVEVYDAAGELRGLSSRCFRDSLYILVISGDEAGEPIVIRPKLSGSLASESISAVVRFQQYKLIGRFKSPLILQPETVTGIDNLYFGEHSQLNVYTLTGQTVYSGPALQFDRRQLSLDGVYIINETTASGQIIVRKVRW